jgi:hypothetical protein
VGDHPYADALGAESVGMLPVLIDRFGGPAPEGRVFVRSLDELDNALGWG